MTYERTPGSGRGRHRHAVASSADVNNGWQAFAIRFCRCMASLTDGERRHMMQTFMAPCRCRRQFGQSAIDYRRPNNRRSGLLLLAGLLRGMSIWWHRKRGSYVTLHDSRRFVLYLGILIIIGFKSSCCVISSHWSRAFIDEMFAQPLWALSLQRLLVNTEHWNQTDRLTNLWHPRAPITLGPSWTSVRFYILPWHTNFDAIICCCYYIYLYSP